MAHTERSMFRDWFEWRWVGIGFLLCLGLNLIGLWAVRPVLHDLLFRQERVLTGAALLSGLTLGICFLVGVVVARLALRRAVKEPAVASVLAILVLTVLQLRLGMINLAGVVLGAPAGFLAAWLVGRLGWAWRKRYYRKQLQ